MKTYICPNGHVQFTTNGAMAGSCPVEDYGMEFYGETKHTYPDEIRLLSQADQVLECREGDNWVDIT